MSNLRAGDLATPVTIKAPTVTKDADGGLITNYTTTGTVWASIQFAPGGRFDVTGSGGSKLKNSVRLKIRYLASLTENHLINFNGRDHEITGIDNLYNLNEYLVLDVVGL